MLVGDAAHPFTPYAGQGASQALVDIFLLGRLIRQLPQPKEGLRDVTQLAELQRRYNELRCGPVNRLMLQSRYMGVAFTETGPLRVGLGNLLMRAVPGKYLLPPNPPSCDPNAFLPMEEQERARYARMREKAEAV